MAKYSHNVLIQGKGLLFLMILRGDFTCITPMSRVTAHAIEALYLLMASSVKGARELDVILPKQWT